jgi:hypothetical protein
VLGGTRSRVLRLHADTAGDAGGEHLGGEIVVKNGRVATAEFERVTGKRAEGKMSEVGGHASGAGPLNTRIDANLKQRL